MAHGGLFAVNYGVKYAIDQVISHLNAGSHLGLFQNNYTVDAGTQWVDLVEATFTGYAEIDLAGLWGASGSVINGEYKSDLPTQTFTATGAAQTVYGWFVVDPGPNVFLAQNLPAPIVMTSGVSLNLAIQLQNWALAIVTG